MTISVFITLFRFVSNIPFALIQVRPKIVNSFLLLLLQSEHIVKYTTQPINHQFNEVFVKNKLFIIKMKKSMSRIFDGVNFKKQMKRVGWLGFACQCMFTNNSMGRQYDG